MVGDQMKLNKNHKNNVNYVMTIQTLRLQAGVSNWCLL